MATSTRDALVAAAVTSARAGQDLSLQRLARSAGLTTGAVYSQFSGRAELVVEAAFAEGGSYLVESVRRRRSLLAMQRAIRAGSSLDPLVLAIVEARQDPVAGRVGATRLAEVCGDPQQEMRLVFGLVASLLGSLGLDKPSRDPFEGFIRTSAR
jgi:AcrR family transcriptional regulator